jgi:anaerobic ribonucleoside-triphosphate reductase
MENEKIKDLGRQKCEIFSRVTWYLRPVQNFNDAKRQEYIDRKTFKEDKFIK